MRTKIAVNSLFKNSYKDKNLIIFSSVLMYKHAVVMKYPKVVKFLNEEGG